MLVDMGRVLWWFASRRSADQRRQRQEREWARRRDRQRRWSHSLRWLEHTRKWDRVGYREAASEIGLSGLVIGMFIGNVALIVAFDIWPDRMKSQPLLVILGVVVGFSVVGLGAGVLYGVHLHHRVRAWRRRHLRRRLARVGGSTAGGRHDRGSRVARRACLGPG